MSLERFGLTKGETNILAIATGILIIGILAVITLMQPSLNDEENDISFLGYKYAETDNSVFFASYIDDEPFEIEITEENAHDVHSVRNTLANTYKTWQRFLRNSLIFLYLLTFFIIIRKKKETQFQNVARGILIGSGIVLLLFTLQLGFDVYSGLIKYGHDFLHLVPLF